MVITRPMKKELLESIYTHFKKIQTVQSISSLAYWDFETMMPKGSTSLRSEQLAFINTTAHQLSTDKKYAEQVMSVNPSELSSTRDQQNVIKLQKELGKSLACDENFVERETKASLDCHAKWQKAREADSFNVVKDSLAELIKIRQEYAQRIQNYAPLKKYFEGNNSYEVLIDSFEPGVSSSYLRTVLKSLVNKTVELLPEIEAKQKSLSLPQPIAMNTDAQHKVVLKTAEALGFDFSIGRIDKSVHPFCGGHPLDTRITTRYNENDVTDSVWSTIHETGHALYEQGLPREFLDFPCGSAASMGVHESQSRFYENQIGKSMPFCQWIAPSLGTDAKTLYRVLNQVKKSFIRTEADEVTYNLHIYLRFQLEEKLILGTLSIDDLEDAWNESFQSIFGLTPPSALKGVIQDTHWFGGMFGYFPTYSLGNLLAAELFEAYTKEFPNWSELVATGSFGHIKSFMNERVHKLASFNDSPNTMKQILGGKLPSSDTLVNYFQKKYLT